MAWVAAVALTLPFYIHDVTKPAESKVVVPYLREGLSDEPFRVRPCVEHFGGVLFEQLHFEYIQDGLRRSGLPRTVVLPGAPGLMVQGTEQAAFVTDHQYWDPSTPPPERMRQVCHTTILAQMQGDHMKGNRQ